MPNANIANAAVATVGLVHFAIAGAEICLWKRPNVSKESKHQLGLSQEEIDKVAPIVANAGLYNAFIAAGLVWSITRVNDSKSLKLFFLSCVVVAGIFGAATLKQRSILLLQTLPALVAAFLVWFAGKAA